MVAGVHEGKFGGGHMPAPGFAMRVGGTEGRFVAQVAYLAPPIVREPNTRRLEPAGVFGIPRRPGPGTPSFFSTRGE